MSVLALISLSVFSIIRPHRTRSSLLRTWMQPVVTDRVAWSVGCETIVCPAKTAELIEMPFGLKTQKGPGNHLLDGGPLSPHGRANFEGRRGGPL